VEGGETLAWEIAGALARQGRSLDRLFVQVGGGALASACVQGLREAVRLGVLARMPRVHPVQAEGAAPLRRAWERVTARIAGRLGFHAHAGDSVLAEKLREAAGSQGMKEELDYAARHRAEFMWPWETEPRSVATGILDDEAYDWLAVVRGTIESGGFPVVVGEERLIAANALARERTGIDVDPTGSAGLAGLCELRESGVVRPEEAVAVLFSGVKR
jgi:threonine synthase